MSIVWDGARALDAALGASVARAQSGAREIVQLGLHIGEAEMKAQANGLRHAKGTPTPAVPGGGPAKITGAHLRSIHVGPINPVGMFGYMGEVGPSMIYSRRIEVEYGYMTAAPGWQRTLPQLGPLARSVWARVLA